MTKAEKQSPTDEELRADLKRAVEKVEAILSRRDVTGLKAMPVPKPMLPEDTSRLRKEFDVSQKVFARLLNVSLKTVQAWEQGTRIPSDAALKLLSIAEHYPDVLLDIVIDSK